MPGLEDWGLSDIYGKILFAFSILHAKNVKISCILHSVTGRSNKTVKCGLSGLILLTSTSCLYSYMLMCVIRITFYTFLYRFCKMGYGNVVTNSCSG